MWALLLGLLGAGAALGGIGGGSSSSSSGSSRDADAAGALPVVGISDDPVDHGDDTMDHGDGHMGDDTLAGDDTVDHGDGHMGDDTMADDDTVDHGDGHMGDDTMDHEPVPLPTTEAEVAAFVAAVRSSPETHSHDMGSSKADEHMAALDLVPRDEATHIAIGHGDWDDPMNWHTGEVPGDDAKVLIPEGIHMTYDHVSDARLFTLRVDGKLEFATDVDSQMIVDTIVTSPSGHLQIGTEANPVEPEVNVDIIFANNGPIDTDWDPMLLSRGMIAHGKVDIHGAKTDSHEKVTDDPMAGDTWVDFGDEPEGWSVGDTIVIAGTRYKGYQWDNDIKAIRHFESEDEVRVITQIEDGMVFFDEPLVYNHDSPRDDLKTSVANYTRNVSFETENAELAEIYERGHVMFMHSDDVDVRYAEFHELGRTDKSEGSQDVSDVDTIEFDSNVRGRYSFHFHQSGVDDIDDPAMAVGNAVYGSPGWGFVHHDSNAVLENNATYDTFGAGYVAESGNETGEWTDNIAIFSQGTSWNDAKLINNVNTFDMGRSGDGFWFQGRLIDATDNVAASVNHGFVYFHRGDGMLDSDAANFDFASALTYDDSISSNVVPIVSFSGNETFASRMGLQVVKETPRQEHDIHSKLEDFTAWSVQQGVFLEYTGHYTLEDFDLIAKGGSSENGISFGPNTHDITVTDSTISGFETGINFNKAVVGSSFPRDDHGYTVVDTAITDTSQPYKNYDPEQDVVISSDDLPGTEPDVEFDAPLRLLQSSDPSTRGISISGTKTDSLGETEFPGAWESFKITSNEAQRLLENDGYYSTSDGDKYFVLDVYFSDRLTGDIYAEKHPVMIDDNVYPGSPYNQYKDAVYNGERDLDGSVDDPTFDSAMLWATLTDGQIVLSDEAQAWEEQEEEWAEANAA